MGTWHAPEEGNRDRRLQQEQQQASGGDAAVARSPIEGLSNKALQGVVPGLTVQLKGMGGAVLDDTIARAIHSKRGSGETLDSGVADSMGKSMGHDFSDVNIHRDGESDQLNKDVHAEAFTTGKDIFFREGKYDPVSNEGQKLLAHELTHVVQQDGAPASSELRVSDPGDASERQASSVADAVTSPAGGNAATAKVGRQEDEEVATQAAKNPDEEESAYGKETNMAMSAARQEGAEEEKEEGAAATVARQEGAEEEKEEGAAATLARQEGAEEEKEEGAAATLARQEGAEEEKEEGAAAMVARDHAEDEEKTAGHAM